MYIADKKIQIREYFEHAAKLKDKVKVDRVRKEKFVKRSDDLEEVFANRELQAEKREEIKQKHVESVNEAADHKILMAKRNLRLNII
jgi:hypothetical protein